VRERNRTANLVKSDAATRKQLDDLNGNVVVIQKQIATAKSQSEILKQQISSTLEQVKIQNRAILSEKSYREESSTNR
jgi:HlyD family secretion protein